jgi:hypothetical protein
VRIEEAVEQVLEDLTNAGIRSDVSDANDVVVVKDAIENVIDNFVAVAGMAIL